VDKVDAGTRLVADAGHTMSEITAASGEQSDGIGQVNVAVKRLDWVVLTLIAVKVTGCETAGMEITPEQFNRIEHWLPMQRGNVSLSNLQVVNAMLN